MTKLSNNVIASKYLSKKEIDSIDELLKALTNNRIVLTCMGLYNHGKSTLLNILIEDFRCETFATSDTRETSRNKSFEQNNFVYVDTPGLNAQKNDDKRVFDAVKESDINLFVHAVTTGELVKNEMDFLRNIQQHWENPNQFIERTIFVLSRIDKANSPEEIEKTKNKISQQIRDIFGLSPLIISVSSFRYKEGVENNKNLLKKKSNIGLLKEKIDSLSKKFADSIRQTRQNRIKEKCNNLHRQLDSKIQKYKLAISSMQKDKEQYMKKLNADIIKVEEMLKKKYKRLEEV
jgi:small GTP-binding protein